VSVRPTLPQTNPDHDNIIFAPLLSCLQCLEDAFVRHCWRVAKLHSSNQLFRLIVCAQRENAKLIGPFPCPSDPILSSFQLDSSGCDSVNGFEALSKLRMLIFERRHCHKTRIAASKIIRKDPRARMERDTRHTPHDNLCALFVVPSRQTSSRFAAPLLSTLIYTVQARAETKASRLTILVT